MDRSPRPPFAPKRLDRRSLETTKVTPGMRLLSTEDREAMLERRQALEDRVSATGTIARGRVVRNVAYATIGMTLISAFAARAGYDILWVQIPVGVALGLFVAYVQPNEQLTGILFFAAGLGVLAVTGYLSLNPVLLIGSFGYYGIGLLIAFDAWLRRTDGV